ncbi:MAG: multicopper oxidase domain-containing protein [Candidatus Nanohaloarchaea archaeon]
MLDQDTSYRFKELRLLAGLLVLVGMVSTVSAHVGSSGDTQPPAYQEPPDTVPVNYTQTEEMCPVEKPGWREAQQRYGVTVQESRQCSPDNPEVVAAVTKGTNNVPMEALMATGLHEDAVRKGKDMDGDGDPDVINITLEVAEINGKKPVAGELALEQAIAPGVKPGFWVFAPKTRGMASEGSAASNLIRAPSPAIRVEEGDRVNVELENTHYMPHTIHFHGVDHPYSEGGEGQDGVPQTSGEPVMPGESRTYSFEPGSPGTMFYHCHVQPNTHVLMGLQGMFIIEEQRPENRVQTFNIGNGKVRHQSEASEEEYDREYDLLYQDVDKELHSIINVSNDPRVISKMMNRRYDVTEREPDYFLLNGKSFPYTVRESQIIVAPDENVKLRILNGGSESVSLHIHGHKPTITHYDGVEASEAQRIQRDVFDISAAQRIDLLLNTSIDGLNSYDQGVWFMHNHKEEAVTTDGVAPGGDVTVLTYEKYLKQNGMPETQGVSWKPYFSKEYYDREVPVWNSYDRSGLFGEFRTLRVQKSRVAMMGIIGLLLGGLVGLGVADRW